MKGPAYSHPSLAALFLCIALVRIVTNYDETAHTIDESTHIAAGLEWLHEGTYYLHPENPPLARIALAIGPYLSGAPSVRELKNQNEVLRGDDYEQRLHSARLGNLPFFLLAGVMVFFWSLSLYGQASAVLATGIFSTLPSVIGHGSLATTDMAATAMTLLTFFTLTRWLELSTRKRLIQLGLAIGLGLLTKFSLLPFLLVAGLSYLGARRFFGEQGPVTTLGLSRRFWLDLVGMAALSLTVLWAGYRFNIGSPLKPEARPHYVIDSRLTPGSGLHSFVQTVAEAQIYPLAEVATGFYQLLKHNREGHRAYLFGEIRTHGWWYFFPVVFFFKSPLPFLLLTVFGGVLLFRLAREERTWTPVTPLVGAVAVIVALLPSGVTIGHRHILPSFALCSMVAGYGGVRLFGLDEKKRWLGPVLAVILVAWHAVASMAAHPDYLAYFNLLAGSAPEKIVVDSDLDWGQDIGRLAEEIERRGIQEIHLAVFTEADLDVYGLDRYPKLANEERTTGWIAASHEIIKVGYWGNQQAWLEDYEPVGMVGKTIRLYHIEELE